MLGVQTVSIARDVAKYLAERGEDAGAVIVMSKKFGAELAAELCPDAGEEGAEPDSLAGVPVVYKEDVDVPTLVTADGRLYDLLPDWAHEGRLLNAQTKIQLADIQSARQLNLGKIPAMNPRLK